MKLPVGVKVIFVIKLHLIFVKHGEQDLHVLLERV